jgi:hypothetical protein
MKSKRRLKKRTRIRIRRNRKPTYGSITKLTEIFDVAKESNTLLAEVVEQIDEQIGHDAWDNLSDATSFVALNNRRYFMDIRVAIADYLVELAESPNNIAGLNWNDDDVGYGIDGYVVDDGVIAYHLTTDSKGSAYAVNTIDDVLVADMWFYAKWSDKPRGYLSRTA